VFQALDNRNAIGVGQRAQRAVMPVLAATVNAPQPMRALFWRG
jgi:hypothetical protein